MKKLFAMLAVALSLTACQPNIPQVPQVLGGEVPAQQAAPADSGMSPVTAGILGAGAGYLMGKAGSNNGGTTIIERDRYVGGNSYNRYAPRPRTTTTTTTVKRSMFGGKTVTRTVRRR